MNRKILTILIIIIQITILGSFIIRYEILKQTGTTVYIPLRGYDPTDIFRGDYVNLSYELPYTGSIDSYSSEKEYLVPEIQGNMISGIVNITKTRPSSGTYFQIKNGWTSQKEEYTIITASGETVQYESTQCMGNNYNIGDTVLYNDGGRDGIISNNSLSREPILQDDSMQKSGKIVTKGSCTGTYRFQTTATDRWFVQDKTGLDLESKIREGFMYAEWKVGNNGAVIITNILTKEELPK